MTGLFYLALISIDMLQHIKEIPLFLRLKHVYSIFCLFIICQWTFVLISPFFAIVNKASRSMGLQISVVDSTFIYFVNINRSGIIRSYGDSMFNFQKLQQHFPQWLYHFAFSAALHMFTSLPKLIFFIIRSTFHYLKVKCSILLQFSLQF